MPVSGGLCGHFLLIQLNFRVEMEMGGPWRQKLQPIRFFSRPVSHSQSPLRVLTLLVMMDIILLLLFTKGAMIAMAGLLDCFFWQPLFTHTQEQFGVSNHVNVHVSVCGRKLKYLEKNLRKT